MAKRMTLIQSSKVSAWMLANADDVANMSPVELAKAVWDCVGVTINHGVAKRHRAQLGIVAVAQPKPVKAPKRTLLSRIVDLECRVEALVVWKESKG